MLAVVGVIALGGAADPASGGTETQSWADWHLVGAIAGIAFIGWTYVVAWNNIRANQAIIAELVAQVRQIRQSRGIEPDGG
jgi:hypothetical protein